MVRKRINGGKIITEELCAGDVVQHFKRGIIQSDNPLMYMYKIICTAVHTETYETMVVYQALYGEKTIYVRPEAMFLDKVDTIKYPNATQKYRFEKYHGAK